MLTPAISASSTSDPWAIMVQAFCTQVTSPPFLNLLPLAEEITTGLAAGDAITAGAVPNNRPGAAARRPAPAPAMRKSRRFSFLLMGHSLLVVLPCRAVVRLRDVRAGASVAVPAGGRPRRPAVPLLGPAATSHLGGASTTRMRRPRRARRRAFRR